MVRMLADKSAFASFAPHKHAQADRTFFLLFPLLPFGVVFLFYCLLALQCQVHSSSPRQPVAVSIHALSLEARRRWPRAVSSAAAVLRFELACLVLSCFFRVHPLGGLFLAHAEVGLHCTVQSVIPRGQGAQVLCTPQLPQGTTSPPCLPTKRRLRAYVLRTHGLGARAYTCVKGVGVQAS